MGHSYTYYNALQPCGFYLTASAYTSISNLLSGNICHALAGFYRLARVYTSLLMALQEWWHFTAPTDFIPPGCLFSRVGCCYRPVAALLMAYTWPGKYSY